VLLFTVTGLAPFGSGAWQVVFRRVYGGTPELGTLEQESPALARAFTAALAPEAKDRLGRDGLLEVLDDKGQSLLLMSAAAKASLTPDQLRTLQRYSRILAPDLTTIETIGGGSARCMVAEIFI